MALEELGSGLYLGTGSHAVIETVRSKTEPDTIYITSGKPYVRWGQDNNYPQTVLDEVSQEVSAANCLLFKADAHYGKGPVFFTPETDEGGKEKIKIIQRHDLPPAIQDFLYDSDYENFVQGIIEDYTWWDFFYVGYQTNKPGTRILHIDWKRAKDVRPAKRDPKTGVLPAFHLSHNFPNPQEGEVAPVPAFDKRDPFRYGYSIYQHKRVSNDRDYFPIPKWHSIMSWLSVAKRIPDWIRSNIDNSMNVKWHIKVPYAYVKKQVGRPDLQDSDEEYKKLFADKAKDIFQAIDDSLTGKENVAKRFHEIIYHDDEMKQYPGWELIPLKADINDQAWLKAYDTAMAAIVSGSSTPPGLANVTSASGLGAGSGSNIREEFNFYLQLRTEIPRQTTLEPFEIVKRVNKWPREIYCGYRNVLLNTIDQGKNGFQTQGEQNPTTNNN
jgi:hypothetical protein